MTLTKTCLYILILFIKNTNCFAFEMYFLFQRICAEQERTNRTRAKISSQTTSFHFLCFPRRKSVEIDLTEEKRRNVKHADDAS